MRQSKSLEAVHKAALAEFDTIQEAQEPVRKQCMMDRRFVSVPGAQWEGSVGDQFANKPRFEFNSTWLAVKRIFSEYRNNRITVDFTPPDGTGDDEMADACDGLYRADEQASGALEAYDNAFEEGVGGGIGAWRLRAAYEDEYDEDNDKQRVRIEPIFDADISVFFDLNAKRQDKSDAKTCYVMTPYSKDAAKAEFGEDVAEFDRRIVGCQFDWVTSDTVWICEHYRKEEDTELVRWYIGTAGDERKVTQRELDEDEGGELVRELEVQGYRLAREKKVKRAVVRKYILSGNKVLSGPDEIPGSCIPIVPFYATRYVIDGIEYAAGHVRWAKDAQRLHNLVLSWLAEMTSRFDIEKPIFTPEQVAGHETLWAEDAVKKNPFMLINQLIDPTTGQYAAIGPAAYTKAPMIPPAMAALAQSVQQTLAEMLGNHQAADELQPNTSGKAVELTQQRLDMQVFIYLSNFGKAHKRSGEIWLSMMRDIAVEEKRSMKTVDNTGKAGAVVLNEPIYDDKKGETLRHDMNRATFEVWADVAPSSSSQRAATVRALTGIMSITQDPEMMTALALSSLMNMEGEGLTGIREWARSKAVRMGVEKPTDEEAQQMQAEQQAQTPDPQAEYLKAEAMKSMAETALTQTKVAETEANTRLKDAQRVETLAKAGNTANSADLARKSDARADQQFAHSREMDKQAANAPKKPVKQGA